MKMIYLAIKKALKYWTILLQNQILAMNRFARGYEDRFDIKSRVNKMISNLITEENIR